jgi:glycerol-3-phosphate dehydrogenase
VPTDHAPPLPPLDALILGGGVAGLWTLHELTARGRSALLLDTQPLGTGQTIASQGIIHGGVKYALTGQASAASRAIADMPALWSACLRGDGPVDLRSVRVLSPCQYLWTTTGLGSRLAGLAASKAIRTGVRAVHGADRPAAFREAPPGVSVYAVDEPVLEPRSLIHALAAPLARRIIVGPVSLARSAGGGVIAQTQAGAFTARCAILTAGAGNARLLEALGAARLATQQVRPLHMVMARGPGLPPIFAHCVHLSDKPRLTITTQPDHTGTPVWYIGGQLAERGVDQSPADLIAAARREVAACLPWLNLGPVAWSTLRVDRAEGSLAPASATTPTPARPDGPVITSGEGVIAGWPTKLALAPLLAKRMAEHVSATATPPPTPIPTPTDTASLGALRPPAPVAPLPWDVPEATWT